MTGTTDTQSELRWQLNRLRCMSVLEIVHRALREAGGVLERVRRHEYAAPAPDLAQAVAPWLPVRDDDSIDAGVRAGAQLYARAADEIAAGRMDILSFAGLAYGMPPRWNRHPLTGYEWPLRHGQALPPRKAARGDIKYLWEPNRHLHLVTLVQAWRLTGEARHANTLLDLLESWFDQCPPARGPNWSSAMEAAIRLINWSLCWQLLGGADSPVFAGPRAALRDRWLASIYVHMSFVRRNLSLHSSANNHIIGEFAGLFIACRTWPYWPRTWQWAQTAQRGLAAECEKQHTRDGVNREQTSDYHAFVFEYLLLAGLCGRNGGADFAPAYWHRLEAMCEYLHLLRSFGPASPAIGDGDGAAVARLAPGAAYDAQRALLGAGALVFGRADFAAGAGELDPHTAWLFGAQARARFDQLRGAGDPLPRRTDFPEGGYCALGVVPPARLRVLFDAGPLGYTSIAAHGHADALAVLLWLDREPVLIDTGTYCYNDQPRWRAYFRGTAAHNTVRVDGLDQSEPGGAFIWLRKAQVTRLKEIEDGAHAARAEHDGYRRLPDPVTHERRIELLEDGNCLRVADILRCAGAHEVEICWHFADSVQLRAEGAALLAQCPAGLLRIEVEGGADMNMPAGASPDAGQWRFYRGEESPPRGWHSPIFGVKHPLTTAVWQARVAGTRRFYTTFRRVDEGHAEESAASRI